MWVEQEENGGKSKLPFADFLRDVFIKPSKLSRVSMDFGCVFFFDLKVEILFWRPQKRQTGMQVHAGTHLRGLKGMLALMIIHE